MSSRSFCEFANHDNINPLKCLVEDLEPLPEEMKNGLAAIEKLDSEVNGTSICLKML